MTVRFYSSEDLGAPVLSGTGAGQMIAILDGCLVNGYGAKPSAGWSKPFSGDDLAVYQQGLGSRGRFLRVDDTQTGSNRAAYTRGYEEMTSINEGVLPFPSPAQVSLGLRNPTGQGSALTAPRLWVLVADEAAFYLWLSGSDSPSGSNLTFFFGDFNSYHPADVGGTLHYGFTNGSAQLSSTSNTGLISGNSNLGSTSAFSYLARRFDQLPGAVQAGTHGDYVKNGSSASFGGGASSTPYPNPADGGIFLSRIWVHESSPQNVVRGEMPGMWHPCHYRPFPSEYPVIVNGEGRLAGRQFVTMPVTSGQILIEVSDTWR